MLDMRSILGLVVIALLAIVGVGAVGAQETSEFADMRALIDGLPRERGADGAFILGDPDAPVTLIEFADFACPHCQRYRETIHAFVEQYVVTGMARLEVRIFPTAGGDRTVYAARVAECADTLQPGGFWGAHEALYALAIVGRYDEPLARLVADELNLDYLALLGCITRANQVEIDMDYGHDLAIGGTPALMVRIGSGEATFITYENTTYDRGGVPLEVLAMLVKLINGDADAIDGTGSDASVRGIREFVGIGGV